MVDIPVWFFAGWASAATSESRRPRVPPTNDQVDLCAVLALVAAAIVATTPIAALISLRRKRQAAQVVCVMAGVSLAIGVVGFAIGLSVIQNPGG